MGRGISFRWAGGELSIWYQEKELFAWCEIWGGGMPIHQRERGWMERKWSSGAGTRNRDFFFGRVLWAGWGAGKGWGGGME